MKKHIDVAVEVDKFLKTLEFVRQFNDVQILRLERQSTWTEQYANFILQFDTLNFDLASNPGPYTRVEFDYDELTDDFRSVLQAYVPKCKIEYRHGCHEFEIQGPKIKSYYKKHADAIETWYEQHPGFSVFIPKE